MDIASILVMYIIGLALIFAEIVLPGGVVGVIGGVLSILAVGIAFFTYGPVLGIIMGVVMLATIPLVIFIVSRLMVHKVVIYSKSVSEEEEEAYQQLVGKRGKTLTYLRPSGIVLIENKKYDVISIGMMVEKGKEVEVVRVEGNRIFVKEV